MFMIKHKDSGMFWGPVREIEKELMDGTACVTVKLKTNLYEDAGKTYPKKPKLIANTKHYTYSHYQVGSVEQLDRRGQNSIPMMPWEWCAVELKEDGEVEHEFDSNDGDDVPQEEDV